MNFKDKIKVDFSAARVCLGTEMESDRYTIIFSVGVGVLDHTYSVWQPKEDWLRRLAKWVLEVKKMSCPDVVGAEYIVIFQNGIRIGQRILPEQFLAVSRIVASAFAVMLDEKDEERIIGSS